MKTTKEAFKASLFYFTVFIGIVLLGVHCQKDKDLPSPELLSTINVAQASLAPCDSLRTVRWGDTLRVVKNTITSGTYKGQKFWQAMLSSNNIIPPTKFANSSTTHRIVVADTTEITLSSVFYVSRIK